MCLKFWIIAKLGHAENFGPNKKRLINESRIMYSPVHTGEEACMETSRVLGGCKTRPIATATLKKLR
jgi:hypothetical protein